jgi:PAS domain-containing protein
LFCVRVGLSCSPVLCRGAVAYRETDTMSEVNTESTPRREERYALAVRGSNDGLWDWEESRNRVVTAPRFNEIVGRRIGAEAMTLNEWLSRIHPEDIDIYCDSIRAHLRGDTPPLRVRFSSGERRRRNTVGTEPRGRFTSSEWASVSDGRLTVGHHHPQGG